MNTTYDYILNTQSPLIIKFENIEIDITSFIKHYLTNDYVNTKENWKFIHGLYYESDVVIDYNKYYCSIYGLLYFKHKGDLLSIYIENARLVCPECDGEYRCNCTCSCEYCGQYCELCDDVGEFSFTNDNVYDIHFSNPKYGKIIVLKEFILNQYELIN